VGFIDMFPMTLHCETVDKYVISMVSGSDLY